METGNLMRFPVKTLTTGLAMSLALTLAGTSALAFPPGTTPPAGMNQGTMPPGHPAMPSSQAPAGGNVSQPTAISGTVVETFESGGYSYVSVDQGSQRIWVASPPVKVAVGQQVSFNPGMVMRSFTSKTLGRTFESIVFSSGLAPAAPSVMTPKTDK
jgi:hypothetical protein